MPDSSHPQRLPLFTASISPAEAVTHHERSAVAEWQALVDARLNGNIAPISPEVLASIEAAERVLGVGRRRASVW